jgi:hypothetical protein
MYVLHKQELIKLMHLIQSRNMLEFKMLEKEF